MKIDILGGGWSECVTCGDQFGTIFAIDMGIYVDRLCFACILSEIQSEERWSNGDTDEN